jgi:hypothetical protein
VSTGSCFDITSTAFHQNAATYQFKEENTRITCVLENANAIPYFEHRESLFLHPNDLNVGAAHFIIHHHFTAY